MDLNWKRTLLSIYWGKPGNPWKEIKAVKAEHFQPHVSLYRNEKADPSKKSPSKASCKAFYHLKDYLGVGVQKSKL